MNPAWRHVVPLRAAGTARRLEVQAEAEAAPEIDETTPRQRRVIALLEDRARRTELVAALAGADGLSPARAATVLSAELGELESSADDAGLDELGAMARAMRKIIEQLGGVKVAHWRQRDVIVLDDNEITRDLITIALQAEGHRVRSAASLIELALLVRERKPHVLLSEARMPDAPGTRFCHHLRVAMALENIPIVLFSAAHGDDLATLAREADADLFLSKDQGIDDLTTEVARLFQEILW